MCVYVFLNLLHTEYKKHSFYQKTEDIFWKWSYFGWSSPLQVKVLVKCNGAREERPPLLFSGVVGIDKSVAEAVFWRGRKGVVCIAPLLWESTTEQNQDLSGYHVGPEAAEEVVLAQAQQPLCWWRCSSYFPNKSVNYANHLRSLQLTHWEWGTTYTTAGYSLFKRRWFISLFVRFHVQRSHLLLSAFQNEQRKGNKRNISSSDYGYKLAISL